MPSSSAPNDKLVAFTGVITGVVAFTWLESKLGTNMPYLLWPVDLGLYGYAIGRVLAHAGLVPERFRRAKASLEQKAKAAASGPIDALVIRDLVNRTESALRKKLLAQEGLIAAIGSGFEQTNHSTRKTPLGVFGVAGPSGTGKTYTASVLAEEAFGDRGLVELIDCARGDVRDLQTAIVRALRTNPRQVFLLDNCGPILREEGVRSMLVTLATEGFIADPGDNSRVPATDAIIMVVSGEKRDELEGLASVDKLKQKDQAAVILKEIFGPELVSSFTRVVATMPFSNREKMALVASALQAMASEAAIGFQIAPGGIAEEVMLKAVEEVNKAGNGNAKGIKAWCEKRARGRLGQMKASPAGKATKLVRVDLDTDSRTGEPVVVWRPAASAPAARPALKTAVPPAAKPPAAAARPAAAESASRPQIAPSSAEDLLGDGLMDTLDTEHNSAGRGAVVSALDDGND